MLLALVGVVFLLVSFLELVLGSSYIKSERPFWSFFVEFISDNVFVILSSEKSCCLTSKFITFSLSIFFNIVRFFVILFIVTIVIAAVVDSILIFYYLRSQVPIRPLENWVEVYEGTARGDNVFYCISYFLYFLENAIQIKQKT